MPQRTMLRTVVHADAGDRVDVHGLSCHQKPRGSPRSMLLLTVKVKEATSAIVLLTTDSQLRKRVIEGFCDNFNLPSSKSNSLERLSAGGAKSSVS